MVIEGILCYTTNGEEDRLLGILPTIGNERYIVVAFAKEYQYNFKRKQVSVRYFVCDKPTPIQDLEENLVKSVLGIANVKYGMNYSDYTGYLWTDEEFNVGGHNLLSELKTNIGKYLYMEVL